MGSEEASVVETVAAFGVDAEDFAEEAAAVVVVDMEEEEEEDSAVPEMTTEGAEVEVDLTEVADSGAFKASHNVAFPGLD